MLYIFYSSFTFVRLEMLLFCEFPRCARSCLHTQCCSFDCSFFTVSLTALCMCGGATPLPDHPTRVATPLSTEVFLFVTAPSELRRFSPDLVRTEGPLRGSVLPKSQASLSGDLPSVECGPLRGLQVEVVLFV